MEFCPKCGTRLISKYKIGNLTCKCGYSTRSHKIYLINKPHTSSTENSIEIIDKKTSNIRTNHIENSYCETCGGNKAYTWIVSTGSEGVSSITFFKCVSCGNTRHEND